MFCFRCGNELPAKAALCPVCDTPPKRRQRRRRRLFAGLLLFLAGAFVGSFVDSVIFRGKSWGTPFLGDADPVPAGLENEASASLSLPVRGIEIFPAPLPRNPAATTAFPATFSATDVEAMRVASTAAASPAATIAVDLDIASIAAAVIPAASAATEPLPIPRKYRVELEAVAPLEEGKGVNYHGSISADGRMLIFSSNRANGQAEGTYQCYFRELHPAGPVTRLFPWSGNVWTPEFSRDGQFLVFSSDSVAAEHVFLRDLNSQQTRQLTDGKSKNQMPCVSPDGRFIAFVSNRKGTNDIWLIGADGGNLTPVTTGPEDDREPRWMPEGQSLVFTRIVDKLKKSFIMKVSLEPLGSPEPLVDTPSRNWLADPSPDGTHLAYVRSEEADGSGNVIRVRSLGSGQEVVLAPFKGSEHYRPIWTSDGLGIVFHADRQKNKSLFQAKLKRIPLP